MYKRIIKFSTTNSISVRNSVPKSGKFYRISNLEFPGTGLKMKGSRMFTCSLLNGTDDELWGFEKNPYDGSLKNNKEQRFGDQNYETYYIYSKKIPNHRLYSDSRGRCAYLSKLPKITQNL